MKHRARRKKATAAAPAQNSARKSWRAWLRAQRPVFSFAGWFVLWSAALTALSLTPPFEFLLRGYLRATAWLSGGLLNRIGIENHTIDATVWSAKYAVEVAESCSGLELLVFFSAAILAFPISWRRKWPGILAGVVLMPLTNLLRVASLFIAGVYLPHRVELIHLEIWPLGLIAITLLGWLGWIQWATRDGVPWRPAP